MTYNIQDLKQSMIGAFSSVLLFFALRGGSSGPFINKQMGFIIFIIWVYLLYHPFRKTKGDCKEAFYMNIFVSVVICTILTLSFGLATWEQMAGFRWFGSPACIASYLALPIAMLFDTQNLKSVLSRYYINKKQ